MTCAPTAPPALASLKPDRAKALFLTKKQLPELVCDAVNLEGVDFTVPEVQTLLDGVTVGGRRLLDETIALNQAAAWRLLFARVEGDEFNLGADFARELHGVLGREESLTWGRFRDGGVTIAGTDYRPPEAGELPDLWRRLEKEHSPALGDSAMPVERIYGRAISVFLRAARAQFFYDCNKRLGRLLMNGILLARGCPVINLPAARQLEFNQLMTAFYPGGDELPMRAFMLDCLAPKTLAIMSE